MDYNNHYENEFIKADRLISDGDVSRGKEIIEEILSDVPDFGRAHNHLGWIFYYKLYDYARAEYHYQLAMKFEPTYGAAYLNYAYLLVDLKRLDEAKTHIKFAIETVGKPDLGSYYCELGRLYEVELDFLRSYKYYNKAKYHSYSNSFIETLRLNRERVKDKMSIFEKLKLKFI